MEPYLYEGDRVLTFSLLHIHKGDVIVFQLENKKYVKRVKKIFRDSYYCEGDNKKDSLDSRKIGKIQRQNILGKVIMKL